MSVLAMPWEQYWLGWRGALSKWRYRWWIQCCKRSSEGRLFYDFSEPSIYECCSLGLYHSNYLLTITDISPTNGTETRCSCEIGYRLLLRYYYADGLRCPMTFFFFCCSISACFVRIDENFSYFTRPLICIQNSAYFLDYLFPDGQKIYHMLKTTIVQPLPLIPC